MTKATKNNPQGKPKSNLKDSPHLGRPTIITKDIVSKLEYTAALDCSISEMCLYADISRDTYYKLIKRNKALSDRFEALRNKPVLKARETFVKALDDPKYAVEYLERKLSAEFAPKQKLEHSGSIANSMADVSDPELDRRILEINERLKALEKCG